MGGDGAEKTSRAMLVKQKSAADAKEDASSVDVARGQLSTCSLTGVPLNWQEPVVVCRLGHLYLKEQLALALLRKSLGPAYSHIRRLSHLIDVRISTSPSSTPSSTPSSFATSSASSFIPSDRVCCPVTGLPLDGKHRFLVTSACGCLVSERATKHVPSTQCLVCSLPLAAEPYIPLAPSPEQLLALTQALSSCTHKHHSRDSKRGHREKACARKQDTPKKARSH